MPGTELRALIMRSFDRPTTLVLVLPSLPFSSFPSFSFSFLPTNTQLLEQYSSAKFVAGAVVMATSHNWAVLAAGRFIVGMAVGAASSVVPVFITEAAPPHLRGTLTVINVVCVSSGQCLASVVDALFSRVPQGWRYMFGISAVPAVCQFIGMLFLPGWPEKKKKKTKRK